MHAIHLTYTMQASSSGFIAVVIGYYAATTMSIWICGLWEKIGMARSLLIASFLMILAMFFSTRLLTSCLVFIIACVT